MSKNYVCVPQIVKVRKYQIDQKEFVECLRKYKTKTNKQIAEILNIPVTMVEYWFRTDKYFDVVSPEYWYQLKNILGGDELNKYDLAVTTYIEREGVFEKAERVYLPKGIAPSILANDSIKVFWK